MAPLNVAHFRLNIELTHENAVQWFQRMELLLRNSGCWKLVTDGSAATDAEKIGEARLAISCNIGDELLTP